MLSLLAAVPNEAACSESPGWQNDCLTEATQSSVGSLVGETTSSPDSRGPPSLAERGEEPREETPVSETSVVSATAEL